jgi:NADH-quinone oxidoreductase subunit G
VIDVTINNITVSVPEGTTILEAAEKAQVHIPTLCHLNMPNVRYVNKCSSCRICMVEVEGRANLVPACATEVTQAMVVKTSTPRAMSARKIVLELLLSDHPADCLCCPKNTRCELQSLAYELGVREIAYKGEQSIYPPDVTSCSFIRDLNKCIMCRRCETVCNNVQTVGVYSAVDRGFDAVVNSAFGRPIIESPCTFCGQCVSVCPTAALTEVNHTRKVLEALNDPDKYVVVQTAPAIRVALGEEFGLDAGTIVTGKMVAALKQMGFDKVLDTDFAADLTVMEEAAEFIDRVKNGGRLPILTSCCPAWVKFFEHQFPDLLDIPSTCKSPHEMMGAIIKTYVAEKIGIPAEKIYVVSVMPCLAKKYEAARPELVNDEMDNVDAVITTRELAEMIRESGINFLELQDEEFDHPIGQSSGASVIFGTTGGVIEATLRTACEWLTGKPLNKIEFHELRGLSGIREAELEIAGMEFRIGIANGLGNTRTLLEKIRNGEVHYDAIEIMACPGGCINGGGQPAHHNNWGILEKRSRALYAEDQRKPLRKSHENPSIIQLYKEYLGEPNSEKAHALLHTYYQKRELV